MDKLDHEALDWQEQQWQIDAIRQQDRALYSKFLARKAAIIAQYGEAFWAYISGDPNAVVTKTHIMEKLMVVDKDGQVKTVTDAVFTGEVKWGYAFKHELERENTNQLDNV